MSLKPEQLPAIQQALQQQELDGWFLSCFQHNDPVSLDLLGLADKDLVSRRCYYLIPAQGEPRRLCHGLEPAMLDQMPGSIDFYTTWRQHEQALTDLLSGMKRIAAHYSPENQIPTISRLDAGTAEFLTKRGIELVSAADLAQQFVAVWTVEQLESHRRACTHLHEIVLLAFDQISAALRGDQAIDEYTVQQFILNQFANRGLMNEADPIVGVNQHAADPHYQPGPDTSWPIKPADFVLIDLWAKETDSGSIYGDITWCGVAAAAPTDRHQEIFTIVRDARDAGAQLVQNRYPQTPVAGYEVDDATRNVINDAGYGEYFIHRTGHSIGVTDHGPGANIDNFETHDTRLLLPMTGFSIEPGIYLPEEFGVRSEINIALTPDGAEITGGEPQRELIRLLD